MELEELEEYLIRRAVDYRNTMHSSRRYCERDGIDPEKDINFVASRARWGTVVQILCAAGLHNRYLDIVFPYDEREGGD